MEKFGGEIGKKYGNINTKGKKALENNEVDEFNSVPEKLKERFNASAFIDSSSEETLKREVLDEIEKIGNDLGIELFLAGRDFPIHISILEGLFTANTDDQENTEEREKVFNELQNNNDLKNDLSALLAGKTIEFKYILIDKGNLILTSVDIPDFILEARAMLSSKYEKAHLKTLSMANILHMTIGRISKLPEDTDNLTKYKELIVKLRHIISASPLTLTISNINFDSSHGLLTEYEN